MKSFVFFGVLCLTLGYVWQSSQSMIDYLTYNAEPPTQSCPDQTSTYGATCLKLYTGIIYQCPYGFYYNFTCRLGKVFPGQLTLNISYNVAIQNTTSESYEELYSKLQNSFSQIFGYTFRTITIHNVTFSATSQRLNIAGDKTNITERNETTVTLITAFDEGADMTAEALNEALNNSSDDFFISFTNLTGCEFVDCDKNTTECTDVKGGIPKCECKPGLDKMNPEDTTCQVCDRSCSAENDKFCLMKVDRAPECSCLPNFEKRDGECKPCSIGFSGEDCQDSYMAIIIGVSTLCGVLLLALIGVTYSLVRKQKPKVKHQQLISNEYLTSSNSSGVPPASDFPENRKIFPRIRASNVASSSRAAADNPTNFHEGGATNRGYLPERDYDNDNWLEMPSKY